MTIWSSELRELEKIHHSVRETHPKLHKELSRLIKTDDENIALVYARRCLEIIISDLCECELKRPRGSEPLKGIIDKLNREGKVPPHIIGSMNNINSISTFGAHPKEFDPRQVKPVLLDLTTVLEWYMKLKESRRDDETGTPGGDQGDAQNRIPQKSGIPRKRIFQISAVILAVAVIIVLLFLLKIFPFHKRSDNTEILEKSIAVLPFIDDSPEKNNEHIINGIMEDLLINLQSIKDLRVPGRTSTEQYRNNPKPIPEIANEMKVSYIIEGSGQRYGNRLRLRVQLVEGATDKHIWADSYDEVINGPEDIFRIQSQLAESIARELRAVITPEEKILIEKVPTTSLTAYDFYQRGSNEIWNYYLDGDSIALESAENLFFDAIKYDSTFAQAYTGLAQVYWHKHYWETIFDEDFLDSALILTEIALSIDDQLAEAYIIRGQYYRQISEIDKAIKDFETAIQLNPNDWSAYCFGGELYTNIDFLKSVQYYHEALSLNRGEQLPAMLANLGSAYLPTGFIDKSKYYYTEAFQLTKDSMRYYLRLGMCEFVNEKFPEANEYLKKAYAIDSTNVLTLQLLGEYTMMKDDHVQSLHYYQKWLEENKSANQAGIFHMHRIGWAFWQNGLKQEAYAYFNKQIEYCNRLIELAHNVNNTRRMNHDLAATYAFLGEKTKAYDNLRLYTGLPFFHKWGIMYLKNDPLFDPIRNDPEFKEIVIDAETKYQAEHERVRQWLEENDML